MIRLLVSLGARTIYLHLLLGLRAVSVKSPSNELTYRLLSFHTHECESTKRDHHCCTGRLLGELRRYQQKTVGVSYAHLGDELALTFVVTVNSKTQTLMQRPIRMLMLIAKFLVMLSA